MWFSVGRVLINVIIIQKNNYISTIQFANAAEISGKDVLSSQAWNEGKVIRLTEQVRWTCPFSPPHGKTPSFFSSKPFLLQMSRSFYLAESTAYYYIGCSEMTETSRNVLSVLIDQ